MGKKASAAARRNSPPSSLRTRARKQQIKHSLAVQEESVFDEESNASPRDSGVSPPLMKEGAREATPSSPRSDAGSENLPRISLSPPAQLQRFSKGESAMDSPQLEVAVSPQAPSSPSTSKTLKPAETTIDASTEHVASREVHPLKSYGHGLPADIDIDPFPPLPTRSSQTKDIPGHSVTAQLSPAAPPTGPLDNHLLRREVTSPPTAPEGGHWHGVQPGRQAEIPHNPNPNDRCMGSRDD